MTQALYEDESNDTQIWYLTANDWSQQTSFTLFQKFIQEAIDPWPAASVSIRRIYCGIGMVDIRINADAALIVEINTDDGGKTSQSDNGAVTLDTPHSLMVSVDFAASPKIHVYLDGSELTMSDFTGSPTETEFIDLLGQEVELLDRIGGGSGGGGATVQQLTTRQVAVWFGQVGTDTDAQDAAIDPETTGLGQPDHYYELDGSYEDTGSSPYSVLYNSEALNVEWVTWPEEEHRCSLTWAGSADADNVEVSVWATIEGWGDYTGQFRVATKTPVFGDGDDHWRPWLAAWPEIMSESDPGEGGVPDGGELSLEIVDAGDALTSEWRTEAEVATYLAEAISASATTFDVDNASTSFYPIAEGSVLWVDNEAILVDGVSGDTLTVTRGALDTDATAHPVGAAVFTALPYLLSRRVRVFIAPSDSCVEDDAVEVGRYRIDQRALDLDTMGVWTIRARSLVPHTSRLVARKRWGYVARLVSDASLSLQRSSVAADAGRPPYWDSGEPEALWRVGEELLIATDTVDGDASPPVLSLSVRGVLGSQLSEIKPGTVASVAFAADPELASTFFRWSPGPTPATSRTSGTWIKSANWIDLILNLLLSSASEDDGLELANRVDAHGAWDCLPPGIGIGAKASEVDWDAMLSVRARTPDWVFPGFLLPSEPTPFGEVISEQLLRPVGAYFAIADGLARIVLPRYPTRLDTGFTIGHADILRRNGFGVKLEQDMSSIVSSVVYEIGRGDDVATMTINDADFASTYGHSGYNEHAARQRKITVESVRPDGDGGADFLRYRGMALLARKRYPPQRLELKTGLKYWGLSVGDRGSVTHGQIPDLWAGIRGVTDAQVEVRSKRLLITPEHTGVDLALDLHRQVNRIGCIAPSASIVSVADIGGGEFEIAVAANRYTDTDADDAGLPVTDAGDFEVGWSLRLVDRAGKPISGDVPTPSAAILAIDGNVITVDSDFGGDLVDGTGNAGQVLELGLFNGYGTEAGRAAFADDVDLLVLGQHAPFRYGEP